MIMHPISKKQLTAIFNELPHCLLLTGKTGVGLRGIALEYAHSLDSTPYIITPDSKGTISIEVIRNMQTYITQKHGSSHIIMIDDADTLSHQAQNALLKSLEEPLSAIHFILLSHTPSQLLPTVRSRAQELEIKPITSSQSEKLLKNLSMTDPVKVQQLLFLANGLPAELTRLAENDSYYNEVSSSIKKAKDFLAASSYQKCIIIQSLDKKRLDSLQFIDHCLLLVKHGLLKHPANNTANHLEKLLIVRENLVQNGNIKAQLLTLL
jgi:DNA polymerase III delta prime subunit